MMEIGKFNTLRIVKTVDFGIYLDGGGFGEILLPKRYVPENYEIDDMIEVFIYNDSEDRLTAITDKPYAMVGEFALLKAVSVNTVGAFLDWGLPKDLLVPFGEQNLKMEEGKSYIVAIYLDAESNRIVASSKLDKFLDNIPIDVEEGQEVDLFICQSTELGYKAIINNTHWGMLYKNEVFQPLNKGQNIMGFVKKIRDDEKIDLCLDKPGYEKIDELSQMILTLLKENDGFIPLNDKSSSEAIYGQFHQSKKTFKKAIGSLYKKRFISIEKDGIRLILSKRTGK